MPESTEVFENLLATSGRFILLSRSLSIYIYILLYNVLYLHALCEGMPTCLLIQKIISRKFVQAHSQLKVDIYYNIVFLMWMIKGARDTSNMTSAMLKRLDMFQLQQYSLEDQVKILMCKSIAQPPLSFYALCTCVLLYVSVYVICVCMSVCDCIYV